MWIPTEDRWRQRQSPLYFPVQLPFSMKLCVSSVQCARLRWQQQFMVPIPSGRILLPDSQMNQPLHVGIFFLGVPPNVQCCVVYNCTQHSTLSTHLVYYNWHEMDVLIELFAQESLPWWVLLPHFRTQKKKHSADDTFASISTFTRDIGMNF